MPIFERRAGFGARAALGLGLGLAALGAVGGCANPGRDSVGSEPPGPTGGDAAFAVVAAGHDRAVVRAKAREIVLAPAPGFCFSADGFDTRDTGAFAVIADCVAETDPRKVGTTGAGEAVLELPPSFPGLVTVAIAGEAMFPETAGKPAALRELRDFLGSAPGLAMLGRNGSGRSVDIRETRAIGDALYVKVIDTDEAALPLLAPEFWRAFIEINRRLVVVTASGFRNRPVDSGTLLAVLASQVDALRRANAAEPVEAETRLAERIDADLRIDGSPAAAAARSLTVAVATPADPGGPDPVRAPAPPPRAAQPTGAPARSEREGLAPRSAPKAPLRPARPIG